MKYDCLDKVNSISDLKSMSQCEIESLCSDIREFLIEKVEQNGGHLASNLGVVELSVALHRVFDTPKDHIIFDVGHQSYVHKILTGRKNDFDSLRKVGGISGFTSRRESEHDAFGAGHSSTALSAALGFAESDKLAGSDAYTVAVVGDGAYTGGMVHEAVNNCKKNLRLIIVLNENGMSISSNKGAFASYISRFRTSKRYIHAKEETRSFLSKVPLIGKPIKWCISSLKEVLKRVIYKTNYFEDLGFYYIGPIDGNDFKKVECALERAKALDMCVFIHIKTTKGKGLEKAENAPEKFHSVSKSTSQKDTYHSVFADEMILLADKHKDIVGVTAAMGLGTGLTYFESKHPDRYFDVGIAEEHALTFSAGLAANGIKPFVAIYSTFLQRGYDNVIHDIALQGLPVKMFIDRAGLAVSDGPTHHGIFDVSFLSHIPGVEIMSPADYEGLKRCISAAYELPCPTAVRYPNASEHLSVCERFGGAKLYTESNIRCDFDIEKPPQNIFVTYGQIVGEVIKAENILKSKGIDSGIILIEKVKPYKPSADFVCEFLDGKNILYVEEGIKNGGAGMIMCNMLAESGALGKCRSFNIAAIDENFANPDFKCDLYDYVGLSAEKLASHFIGIGV